MNDELSWSVTIKSHPYYYLLSRFSRSFLRIFFCILGTQIPTDEVGRGFICCQDVVKIVVNCQYFRVMIKLYFLSSSNSTHPTGSFSHEFASFSSFCKALPAMLKPGAAIAFEQEKYETSRPWSVSPWSEGTSASLSARRLAASSSPSSYVPPATTTGSKDNLAVISYLGSP